MKQAEDRKTELVCILDRSGSMGGLETDTIGGFNGMLNRQRKLPGKLFVTTVLFDDSYEMLYSHRDVGKISPMTENEYFVRGCTAMLDAIGIAMDQMKNDIREMPEEERPDDVIFFITTDGYENASTRFSYEDIKKKISTAKEKYGWEFIFSAANIDEKKIARELDIDEDRVYGYEPTGAGVDKNMKILHCMCADIRTRPSKKKSVKKSGNQ